jgi:Domain of unknown function (DUF4440)/NIPSNAP
MKNSLTILLFCCTTIVQAQTMTTNKDPDAPVPGTRPNTPDIGKPNSPVIAIPPNAPVIEIRTYTLKPGTRDSFHKLLVEQSIPMAKRWGFNILGYGPSLQEDSSYYLIRAYRNLEERQKQEDAFYGSDEWKKGPREAIVSRIIYYTTVIFPADSIINLTEKINAMTHADTQVSDSAELSVLNKQFIRNFVHQDAASHNEIIHKDFVCIQSNGSIVPREQYLKDWATAYEHSGYTSFDITDELIRIFGNTALVRSKTVYTKSVDHKPIHGNSVYTDTYVKENGSWKCVQAQITPVATR